MLHKFALTAPGMSKCTPALAMLFHTAAWYVGGLIQFISTYMIVGYTPCTSSVDCEPPHSVSSV